MLDRLWQLVMVAFLKLCMLLICAVLVPKVMLVLPMHHPFSMMFIIMLYMRYTTFLGPSNKLHRAIQHVD